MMPPEKHDAAHSEDLIVLREKNQHEYAMALLAARERDFISERGYREATMKHVKLFLLIALAIIIVFAAYALYIGKDQFLAEIARYILVGGGGGGLGYAWGFHRGKRVD